MSDKSFQEQKQIENFLTEGPNARYNPFTSINTLETLKLLKSYPGMEESIKHYEEMEVKNIKAAMDALAKDPQLQRYMGRDFSGVLRLAPIMRNRAVEKEFQTIVDPYINVQSSGEQRRRFVSS